MLAFALYRIADEPTYEFAELTSEQMGKPSMPPNGVKISVNATTGQFNMEAGKSASEETQEAVHNSLIAKMTEVATGGKADEDKKKAVEDQKKAIESVAKAADEARQTQQKAKKMAEEAKEEAKKTEESGKKKL